MKIYLAARYSSNPEMRAARDRLVELGHSVTSRWIDLHGGTALEAATAEKLNRNPEQCAHFAVHDLQDVDAADLVVSFTDPGGRGGRHVEFGYALAKSKSMILIGQREHVFHTLAHIIQFDNLDQFLTMLGRDSA